MRNSTARRILAETPPEIRQFVIKYGEIVARIYDLLEEKHLTQKGLAEQMGKKPSEISKWLGGNHNFTLLSLAKLEVELGEDLIQITQKRSFHVHSRQVLQFKSIPRVEQFSQASKGAFTPVTNLPTELISTAA